MPPWKGVLDEVAGICVHGRMIGLISVHLSIWTFGTGAFRQLDAISHLHGLKRLELPALTSQGEYAGYLCWHLVSKCVGNMYDYKLHTCNDKTERTVDHCYVCDRFAEKDHPKMVVLHIDLFNQGKGYIGILNFLETKSTGCKENRPWRWSLVPSRALVARLWGSAWGETTTKRTVAVQGRQLPLATHPQVKSSFFGTGRGAG